MNTASRASQRLGWRAVPATMVATRITATPPKASRQARDMVSTRVTEAQIPARTHSTMRPRCPSRKSTYASRNAAAAMTMQHMARQLAS